MSYLLKKFFFIFLVTCVLSGCVSYSRVPLIAGKYRPTRTRVYGKRQYVKVSKQTGRITVKKGDTVYKIARKYNVPVRSFIKINRLRSPYRLRIGQRLQLPPVPYHIVKKGDTVYGVSRRYQVSVSSFARLNRLKEPYTISIGQKLLLPDSVKKESAFSVAKRMRVKKKTAKKYWKKASSSAKSYKEKRKKTVSKRASSIPKPLKRSTWHFAWPVEGKLLSKYGKAGKGRYNDGINIEVSKGTPVLAAENGVIVYSGNELRGFGNLLLVKHSDGWMSAYAHNDKIVVKYGQKIKRGQKIALAGNTGNVSKPQLHFEIRSGGRAVNPLKYMRKM